jgi:protein-L-isoaspartate O-methyltransferase
MYAIVMTALGFQKGLSFLNVGSGSGYLSCLVLDIVGPSGLCHGIDIDAKVVNHSRLCCAKWIAKSVEKLEQDSGGSVADALLQQNIAMLRESISFVHGNCFLIDWSEQPKYDRIYVGAGCPEPHKEFFYNLLAVGGILVLPINETGQLVKVRRLSECVFSTDDVGMCRYADLQGTDGVLGHLRHDTQTLDTLRYIHQLRAATSALSVELASTEPSSLIRRGGMTPEGSRLTGCGGKEVFCESTNSADVSTARLPSSVWAPNQLRHQQFPASFRRAAVTVLMCASRHEERPLNERTSRAVTRSSHRVVVGFQSVPSQVWIHVLTFCHR